MFKVKNVVPGPLGEFTQGLADFLVARGHTAKVIAGRLDLLAHLSRWLDAEGIASADCDEATAARFVAAWSMNHRNQSADFKVAQLLTFLREQGVVPAPAPTAPVAPGPVDVVLARWGHYLAGERGVKTGTVLQYRRLAAPFVRSRMRGDVVDFVKVDARVVNEFVVSHIPGLPVVTATRTLTALRSLLQFLFLDGVLGHRLDGAVPSRPLRRIELPRGVAPGDVDLMLTAIDLSSRAGIRDRAILMVLARLGLRANEIASMTLDDFDWRAGTVLVRGKGGQFDVLPLPADVGEALLAHLQQERNPAMVGRAVFFCAQAPYHPITAHAVVGLVRAAGLRAGLGPVGAHRLRHGVATSMVNAGASLEEVAQLLRHRSLSSTSIYAKVDLTRLGTVVRPWPGSAVNSDGGSF